MHPYTLKLDPDPEFWPNLDSEPGLCRFMSSIFKKNNFFFKDLKFCLYFILYLHIRIRIHIGNTDPDPESS